VSAPGQGDETGDQQGGPSSSHVGFSFRGWSQSTAEYNTIAAGQMQGGSARDKRQMFNAQCSMLNAKCHISNG
jgi:hypothetical protein